MIAAHRPGRYDPANPDLRRARNARMATLNLRVNGKERTVEDVDPATPLLWVLRDSLGLVGTKFGCGMALCGACTVLVDGAPMRACSTPAARRRRQEHHHHRRAWRNRRTSCIRCSKRGSSTTFRSVAIARRASSCRPPRCSRARRNPRMPTSTRAMAGNLCRCGTYQRIRAAIHTAAGKLAQEESLMNART